MGIMLCLLAHIDWCLPVRDGFASKRSADRRECSLETLLTRLIQIFRTSTRIARCKRNVRSSIQTTRRQTSFLTSRSAQERRRIVLWVQPRRRRRHITSIRVREREGSISQFVREQCRIETTQCLGTFAGRCW